MIYTEEYLKNCDYDTILELYNNQYDEDKEIPNIDMILEEGDMVFKIYCYGNTTKYLCRVFDDPNSNFNNFDIEELMKLSKEELN